MRLFEKLFCKHKWKSHDKKARTNKIKDWENGNYITLREFTREVFICEKCGKIKQIEY